MLMKNVYIFIKYSGEPSGAEKRFLNIWKNLVNYNKPVYLVTHLKTLDYILLNDFERKFVIIYNSKKLTYLSQLFSIYQNHKKIDKNSILHFTNSYFPLISLITSSSYVISWLQPFSLFSFKNLKIRHFFLFLIGFLFAKNIDVLNPKNYKLFKNIFFFKKLFNTPISNNVDKKEFYPETKNNSIVFLGRLESDKGVSLLLNSIKFLDNKLKSYNENEEIIIYILGKGPQESVVKKFIYNNCLNKVKIKNFYTNKPNHYLNKSKIFVSLQQSSNYPSRALVEAMFSGCIPIITNTEDSELMGSKNNLLFINKKIKPDQLSDIILNILSYDDKKIKDLSMKIRKEAIVLFDNDKQINYFNNLYFNNIF